MTTHYPLTISVLAACLLALTPNAAKSADARHEIKPRAGAGSAAVEQSPVRAPKTTVAVGPIEAIPGQVGPYTAAAAGSGVAAMLSAALDHSGRFIVAEREVLSQVLNEQNLVANGLAHGSAGPRSGALIPAQYLITGAVTELSSGDDGSSIGAGLGLAHGLFGGLSLSSTSGRVAIDLRLVNTWTGQVEDTFSVRKNLSSTSVGFTGGYKAITLGGNQFWSTPLGEAMRAALDEAVGRIAKDISKRGWSALVAQVSGNTIYVNAGSEAGLKVGDHLVVERATGQLTDPATNRVLAVQKAQIANIELTAVDAEFATGAFVQTDEMPPQRGDDVAIAP